MSISAPISLRRWDRKRNLERLITAEAFYEFAVVLHGDIVVLVTVWAFAVEYVCRCVHGWIPTNGIGSDGGTGDVVPIKGESMFSS